MKQAGGGDRFNEPSSNSNEKTLTDICPPFASIARNAIIVTVPGETVKFVVWAVVWARRRNSLGPRSPAGDTTILPEAASAAARPPGCGAHPAHLGQEFIGKD